MDAGLAPPALHGAEEILGDPDKPGKGKIRLFGKIFLIAMTAAEIAEIGEMPLDIKIFHKKMVTEGPTDGKEERTLESRRRHRAHSRGSSEFNRSKQTRRREIGTGGPGKKGVAENPVFLYFYIRGVSRGFLQPAERTKNEEVQFHENRQGSFAVERAERSLVGDAGHPGLSGLAAAE
jgi:hypothetical protein